jgi:hypothetical protein
MYKKILPGSHLRMPYYVGTKVAESIVCFEITNEKHEKCLCRGTAVVWQCCGMCAEERHGGGEQLFKLDSVHLTAMRQRATGAQWFLEHLAAVPSWNEL